LGPGLIKSASVCIGRVGGLAVFLGVGVALATGCGVAAADAGSSGSSSSSAGKPATSNPVHSSATSKSSSAGKQASKTSASSTAATSASVEAVTTPALNNVDAQTSSTASGKQSSRGTPALTDLSSSTPTPENSNPRATKRVGVTTDPIAAALSALSAVATSPAPAPASTASVASTLQATPSLTAAATALVNPNTLRPQFSPLAIAVGSVAVGADYALAISRQLILATYWRGTPNTVNPTLELNGYNLVASSTEEITSFYGNWTNWPGGPTTVQGQQQFDVVDPQTGGNVGSFNALVSSGSPLTLGSKTVELLVTSNDGTNVGTAAGQVPPVGSLIANQSFGPFGFGWSYSAMPTPSGTDVVSFKLVTPFGNIPIPISYDAAKGIADHTVDNSPIDLGNGYSIAPADPNGETFTAITGVLPLFSALEGHQTYNIYDSSGHSVGSFEGVFTPTADIGGGRTEAILVTSNDGINVGTNPGQVPPVGSVYNVFHVQIGTGDWNFLYSSLPSTSGDVISFLDFKSGKVSNVGTFLFTLLNASAPPSVKRLAIPGGNSFYPISPLQPSGVNGLPPREMEEQGYQQFGVYDSSGTQTGSFDADVSTQWDLLGGYSQALLVTKVTDGTAGTNAGDVPPVGSVFDYVSFGNTGFGTYYAAIPSPSGDVTTFKLVTPLMDIPLFTNYNASKDPSDYTFYDPFSTV
jgi:hypothetical protein